MFTMTKLYDFVPANHPLRSVTQVTQADGMAERDTAAQMLAGAARFAGTSIAVGADENYDTAGFVATRRANNGTPHVAPNFGRAGGSAIDARTTRWPGYAISHRKRKCIEQVFGRSKTIGRIRRAMYRGLKSVD